MEICCLRSFTFYCELWCKNVIHVFSKPIFAKRKPLCIKIKVCIFQPMLQTSSFIPDKIFSCITFFNSLTTGGNIWRIVYHEMDTCPAISYYNRLLTKFFTLKYKRWTFRTILQLTESIKAQKSIVHSRCKSFLVGGSSQRQSTIRPQASSCNSCIRWIS